MRISDWSSDVCSSDLVTFTGSTAVGRHIAGVCGDRIARVALELGGKSAAIILDDMPIDDVVTKLLPASTTLSGQACSALTRVIVPRHRHRSEEHTSELQSLMRISYAVFCLKKNTTQKESTNTNT